MGALFNHFALLHHQDVSGPDDGRQAMGDNNHRPVVNQVIDSFLYRQLAIDIQRGGRLIKNDDWRIFQ